MRAYRRWTSAVAAAIPILLATKGTYAQVVEFSDKTTFESALSSPRNVDFDGLPASSVMVGNEFQSLGVTISNLQDGELNVFSSPPVESSGNLVWGSLPNGISSSYASTSRPGYVGMCCGVYFNDSNSDDIRFTFAAGAWAAGIHVGENDGAGVTVRFLDQNNSVIHSKYFPPFSPGFGYYGITSSTRIAAMEVLNAPSDGDGIFYDDLVFQPLGDEGVCTPPPPGMVAWWPGDGDANDIRGGHVGTLLNGATFAAGMVGQAFSVDGVDDQVSVPDAPDLRFGPDHPITVDLWAYRTGTTPIMHLVGKRSGCHPGGISYQMALNTTIDSLDFGGDYGGVGTVTDLPLNRWTHLAGSFDGSVYRFYIDGELVASTPGPSGLGPDVSDPLLIGGSGSCDRFQGRIDEVEIFDRALEDTEIHAIFAAGAAGKCKVPDMDADTVPDAADNCPNVPNPAQTNIDGDAYGAACDCNDGNGSVYPGAPQICDGLNDDCGDPQWPAVPASEGDPDGDQVPSCSDNCPLTPNASQQNSGGSSCGDACDPTPITVRFTPRTLNKRAQGLYIKLHLTLGGLHSVSSVDPNQPILLSVAGGVPLADVGRQVTGSGIDISFSRQDVAAAAPTGQDVEFRVSGGLTYACPFEGVDQVRVIQEGKVHTDENDASSILDDAPRVDLDNVRANGNGNLGPAVCLPDYHANYDFSVNRDVEVPPPGKVFVYLYKFCNGTPNCSYGQTTGGQERTVGSGGCP